MSLQVWLPLNGNLENQGLSNVTITNNGATVDNNGKIGKCYAFNNDTSYISLTSTAINNCFRGGNNPFSIACWILHADTSRAIIFGDYSLTGAINFNLELSSKHAVRFYWAANPDIYFTTVLTINTWQHVAVIYDGTKLQYYLNGELKDTQTYTLSTKSKTNGEWRLGRDSRTGATTLNGKLNDFRVYDHALSAKEVKELSKGLVLHYRLAGPGGANLYKDTYDFSTSVWGNIGGWIKETEKYNGFTVRSRSDRWGGPYQNIPCSQNDIFTISFYAKVELGGTILSIHRSNLGNVTTGLAIIDGNFNSRSDWVLTTEDGTQWKYYWGTVKIVDPTITYLQWRIENSIQGKKLYLAGLKLEKGSIATPWCPNPADALYSAMGYNNNIEYDCSGYHCNGTKRGTITWDVNSARYATSYKFGVNSYICAEDKCRPIDAITVAWWGYLSNWSNYNRAISCTEGGGWNFEPNSSKMSFPLYQAGVGYIRVLDSINLSSLSSGWHHWVATFNKGVVKLYRDGTLVNTYTSSSQNGIQYNTNTGLFIGAEAGGSLTSPATAGTFNGGNLSDIRIYATALSAEDIAELYHSAVIVDNTGKSYAYEYFEAN